MKTALTPCKVIKLVPPTHRCCGKFSGTALLLAIATQLITPISFGAEISLAWDPSPEPDVQGYRVYYGTESGAESNSVDVGSSTLSTLTDMLADTTYYFVVKAYNASGLESLPSNEISAHLEMEPDTIPPSAPLSLVAAAGDGSISLDWSDNEEGDLTVYTLYRSVTSGGGFIPIATGIPTSAYLDSGLVNGTGYFYVVTASDSAGNESPHSHEATATATDMTAPIVNLTTGSSVVSADFDVAVGFDEPVSGLDLGDFSVSGGSASSLSGSGANYNAMISPSGSATITVELDAGAAIDAGGNGNLVSNALAVQYENPGEGSQHYANSETTQRGSVSGSLDDLSQADGSYEILTEGASGGKPRNRFSQLQHTWVFDVSVSNPVLVVSAFHAPSDDGDDFGFSYSVDGVDFIEVITITQTQSGGAVQTAPLGNVSGAVWIRVDDTNHSPGSNISFDRLYVDALRIESGGDPNPGESIDMYISKIAMSSQSHGRNRSSAIARVAVVDESGLPVVSATVSGNWTGAQTGGDSVITNGEGLAVFESGRVKDGGFTFSVESITANGFSYDPLLNVETTASVVVP